MAQVLLKDNYFDITLNSKNEYDYDTLSFQFIDFRKWLKKQDPSSYKTHTVNQLEQNLLDLISFEEYGTESYWWIIAIANNMLDPVNDVKYGTTLIIPTRNTISTYIATLTKQEQTVVTI